MLTKTLWPKSLRQSTLLHVWILALGSKGPMADATLTLPIRSAASGTPRLILIECKDWKRPVGIGAIDALESKRRDLQVSVAMICSNSGFTEDALRKAARV